MMLQIGRMNTLKVVKRVRFGLYLASDEGEILLPRKSVPGNPEVGSSLDVFVYTDSEDRLIATTSHPHAMVGEFAGLRVKDVNRVGAFLDWGLDKDLFVPFREQLDPMTAGQSYLVRVCLDEVTQRVIATSKLRRFLNPDTSTLREGQEVHLLIGERIPAGFRAIVDGQYMGLLHENDVFEDLRIGDRREGYIRRVRDDGKLDLALQPQGYRALMATQSQILKALEEAGGFLPFTAKSDPKEIAERFGLSKKAFKKLIGGLYKARKIVISDNGIHLPASAASPGRSSPRGGR